MVLAQKRQGYLLAFVAPLVIFVARYALHGLLGEQALLLPFVLAVMAAAWRGGFGPGVLATVLSALVEIYFFVPPERSLLIVSQAYALTSLLFVIIGITVSHLFEALQQAQRRDAEQQFRMLADSIPQLVWMARPDGHRFWFNARWYEYTGLQASESLGSGWLRAIEPAEAKRVMRSWQSALAHGEPWEQLSRIRRHDGIMRWHLGRAVPVKDPSGAVFCWFGTSTDVSDRIEAEQVLQQADRRKDEFLAVLAHELRNPLAAMTGALDVWPLVANDPVRCDNLRQVLVRQVEQVHRLIEDLLDISRIRQGKLQLQTQPVDLAQVLERASESVRSLIDARGHQLIMNVPTEPSYVQGDPLRLTQVFVNLLNNAAKYTDRGGCIAVLLQGTESSVVVRIRDNGVGIPPEMLNEIFEIFHQVHHASDRSHGGLGIGLTLVKQLIGLHAGSIEAHSQGPGQGSEFVVTLPRLVPAGTAAEAGPACPAVVPPPSPQTS
jgi:PAS domain S-box-containing protein